jgi:hypothetical protein
VTDCTAVANYGVLSGYRAVRIKIVSIKNDKELRDAVETPTAATRRSGMPDDATRHAISWARARITHRVVGGGRFWLVCETHTLLPVVFWLAVR